MTATARRVSLLVPLSLAGLLASTAIVVACGSDGNPSTAANAGGAAAQGGSGATVTGGSAGLAGGGSGNADPDTIPVRYVMLTSTDASSWQKRYPRWTDCTDATVDASDEAACMPGAVLGRFNDDFGGLAATRPFVRRSFEVRESPFAVLRTQAGEVDVCGTGRVTTPDDTVLNAETFAVPGTLTVVVVEDIEGAVVGFAGVDQRLNASHGAWIVLEASAPLFAFEHELGHVIGLEHFMTFPQNYEYCGGMSWDPDDYTTDCVCEFNAMGILLRTVADDCTCHQGTIPARKLDSPLAAPFVSHVAECWFNDRRRIEQCEVHYADESTLCEGVDGNVSCYCPFTQSYFETQSCSAAGAEQLRADAIQHCPNRCNAAIGQRGVSCSGSPYEVTCECSDGGPTFKVPGCSAQYANVIEERANAACGIARCQSEIMPEVSCEGLALDMIPCQCPNGREFYTTSNCSVLDNFVEYECSIPAP